MKKTLVSAVVMMVFALGLIGAAQATPVDNLISNGNFEQSTNASPFLGWDHYDGVTLGNAAYHPELGGMSGNFALLGACPSSGVSYLSQTFDIEPLTESIHLSFNWALSYYDMSCRSTDSLFVLYQNGEAAPVLSITFGDLISNSDGTCLPFGAKHGIYTADFDVNGNTAGTLQFTLQEACGDPFGFGSFRSWLDLTNSIAGIDNVFVAADGGTAPVPEPATLLLLGSGLIGLAGFRRKRG
jgi:hypothetical protein